MVAEMQMMKERMNFMMNAFKGQELNDLDELVHQTDSPFTAPVTSFLLPAKFRMSQIEAYDGWSHSKLSCTYKVFQTRSYVKPSQIR